MAPMEALAALAVPEGPEWQHEPFLLVWAILAEIYQIAPVLNRATPDSRGRDTMDRRHHLVFSSGFRCFW
jgi:hypothetical protein